ncbi:hypothetical protein HMPREF1210_00263 [Paenisporosarcina sp. HGH0030]|uniref:VanW family protein n=1 Tax=Paenisporosarcina sp. HGH0030 TaxID=1078085 RepID=UPI00034E7EEE|nr:VanW family protein [Paenisporosarcina sp. HGH0030]EPD54277.1 hypothetical protein HMPREF1210_00263 [Paenisporosarcina sp. HGH0030]
MNNKLFGTTFVALLGSTVLFFGVTQAGTYVIDEVVFPSKGFGEQTYIGPYDVSNLPENEAAVTVQTGVKGWYGEASVQIKLQDAVVPFPVEVVQFNTDSTLTNAQDGAKNELQFDVTKESVGTFLNQQFAPMVFNDEEIAIVTETIREQLAAGRKDQIIDITSALLANSTVETAVTNVTFNNIESSVGIRNLMTALNGYVINPKSTFSMLEFIESTDLGNLTEQDLTTVASILYASVLQTNFGVDERSIGPVVPTTVPLGFEASINRELGVDFVFTNPNATGFTINLNGVGAGLNASLTGFPFVYQYETTISDKQEFLPKTIKQYSSFVEPNTVRVKTQGENGIQVAVFKNIRSDSAIIETKEVSKDFYPPVHKVEIHPLTVTIPAAGSGDGTGTTDGSESTKGGSNGQPSTGAGTGTAGDGTSIGGSTDSGSTNDTGSNANDENDSEPQYDKGGNLIPPSK